MKLRSNQFGMRENTASSRQHALRLAPPTDSKTICAEEESPKTELPLIKNIHPEPSFETSLYALSPDIATGTEARNQKHLLTIHEVAELLQVPVSWVYEHTRRRCTDRIPGFRLGKYWRFTEEDLTAWLAAKRRNDYRHA